MELVSWVDLGGPEVARFVGRDSSIVRRFKHCLPTLSWPARIRDVS